MRFHSTRFGTLDIEQSKVITMPDGIIGFPERYFVILTPGEQGPFSWYQSVDSPDIAFVVVQPALFFPDYRVKLTSEESERLALGDDDEMVVLTIVTMAQSTTRITANLQGPIIINPVAMTAKQIVLEDSRYSTKHQLFPEQPPRPHDKVRTIVPVSFNAMAASTRLQAAQCA